MVVLGRLLVVLVAVVVWYVGSRMAAVPPLPNIDPNPWWGPGEPREQNTNVRPFVIDIPKKDIDDFKTRLSLPDRLVPALEGANFTYGVHSVAMSVILNHWRDNYDWSKRQKRLNTYKHYKTRISGLDIHFLRASPPAGTEKKVVPLLMVHGWPGSIVEFYGAIPLLTNPQPGSDFVFDVICPSIPGYGFSEPAARPGMNTLAAAQVFVKLMDRLGFDQFYAQGGDWGSAITTDIATAFPEKLLGLHVNMVFAMGASANVKLSLGSVLPSGWVIDPKLEPYVYPLSRLYSVMLREMGYMHLHATKPDTVGVALNTSPQGLAAYILEKFSSWTNMNNTYKKDGGLLDPDFPISLDAMLDNICVYWFTNSITSSMRFYAESFHPDAHLTTMNKIPTNVPTGIAVFVNDLVVTPKNIAAYKYTNIVTYTRPSDAGHFAAMEDPKNFAADVHNFVNTLERRRAAEKKQKL